MSAQPATHSSMNRWQLVLISQCVLMTLQAIHVFVTTLVYAFGERFGQTLVAIPALLVFLALWAAIGASISVFGPLLSGLILQVASWPWVFWIIIPLALVALVMALKFIPAHINKSPEKVDNIGGILSVVLVGAFVLSINFLPVAGAQQLAIGLLLVAAIALILFVVQQRRAQNPLYDLKIARRRPFWRLSRLACS